MNKTRGIRNNNPANIRRSASRWLGLSPIQSDKAFCQFIDIKFGIRAFFILMRTYRYRYNCKTPRQILSRFAPAPENNLDAYIGFISSKGFMPDNEIYSNECYAIFAKYVFRFESQYVCNCAFLRGIMDEMNCFVINKKKECHELTLF